MYRDPVKELCAIAPLAHNTTAPLRAVHLYGASHAQANATVPKQRRVRFRVDTKIEVEVRSVLVRPRKTRLRAQRVA